MSRPMLATLLLALLPWAMPCLILAEDQGKDVDKADEALPELLHAESEGKVRIDGKNHRVPRHRRHPGHEGR